MNHSKFVNYLPMGEGLDGFRWSLTALKVKNTIRKKRSVQFLRNFQNAAILSLYK